MKIAAPLFLLVIISSQLPAFCDDEAEKKPTAMEQAFLEMDAALEKSRPKSYKDRDAYRAWAKRQKEQHTAFLAKYRDKAKTGLEHFAVAKAAHMLDPEAAKRHYARAWELLPPGKEHERAGYNTIASLVYARPPDQAKIARAEKLITRYQKLYPKSTYADNVNLFKKKIVTERGRKTLIGKPAPELKVVSLIGAKGELSIAKLKGKVVLLDFTATW